MSRTAALCALCAQLWAIGFAFAPTPAVAALCGAMAGVWTLILIAERGQPAPDSAN